LGSDLRVPVSRSVCLANSVENPISRALLRSHTSQDCHSHFS
jgi:hypothetical protein